MGAAWTRQFGILKSPSLFVVGSRDTPSGQLLIRSCVDMGHPGQLQEVLWDFGAGQVYEPGVASRGDSWKKKGERLVRRAGPSARSQSVTAIG